MPYTAPTVNYSATGNGTFTTLTGVQSVSVNRGRQNFQDPIPRSTCTIELIPANSYALPLAIGQFIDVRVANSGTSPCYFTGQITDVERSYDIPYNSGTGAAPGDRITITASGGTGALGTAKLTNYPLLNGKVSDQIRNLAVFCNVSAGYVDNDVKASAQTLNMGALDAVNSLLRTGQFFLDDLDFSRTNTDRAVFLYPISAGSSAGLIYSDTGPTKYKTLEYRSSAQSTFNYVEVSPTGLNPQVTSAGVGPYNSLEYSTYNETESDALSLSSYLYNLLSGQLAPVPFTLSTNTAIADTCMTAALLSNSSTLVPFMGRTVQIVFRGTTVTGSVQGISSNFYSDYASVQLYLSPSLGTPFTLDSSAFGVLDTNRLGYP